MSILDWYQEDYIDDCNNSKHTVENKISNKLVNEACDVLYLGYVRKSIRFA